MKFRTLYFSMGNSKLGNIANFNLLPVVTCRHNAPCTRDCYACKGFHCMPNVRKPREVNTEAVQLDLNAAKVEIVDFCHAYRPQYFRVHESGDFYCRDYVAMWIDVARSCPDTVFYAYTKQFENVRGFSFPDNFRLILSAWPSLEIPSDLQELYPVAWLNVPEENRIPENAFHCPGSCSSCGYCMLGRGDVVFNKH